MKNKLHYFPVLLSAVLILALFSFAFVYSQTRPVSKEKTDSIRLEISSGMSVGQVSRTLKQLNIIKNQKLFYYSIRFPFLQKILFPKEAPVNNFVLKSGIYYLDSSMNYVQLQKALSSGAQEYIKVSVPEGLTISQIAKILEDKGICSSAEFISECHDSDLLEKHGINCRLLEGFLFPDTYYLTSGMTAKNVAAFMLENFFNRINEVSGAENLTSSKLYETVILASIVEREYRIPEEAPLIASVFRNRIKHNIGLYSCATIVYILTEIEGRPHPDRVLLDDLKIDNPYNTYKWAGLTPGPISNPGLVALDAAVNTPVTDYYFFQIADQNAGRHVFSTSFEEHKASHNLSVKK